MCKHMEIYEKVCAAWQNLAWKHTLKCLCISTQTHHIPAFPNLFWPGKLLFGNDNNNNGGFTVCSHVGLAENRVWVWEVWRSRDKAGGSAWCLWCTVVPLATFSSLCNPVVWPWLLDPLHSPLVQLYHRRRTSLAHVNISLGLFLEVQKDKIPLEITELTQNNEEESEELWKNH